MKTLLERGTRFLADKGPRAAAVSVTIHTPQGTIGPLDAIPGRRDFAEFSAGESDGTVAEFDWIVAADALFVDAQKREPAPGWEVHWRDGDGNTRVYVALPVTGTRCFDVSDRLGMLYRIHTKLDRVDG